MRLTVVKNKKTGQVNITIPKSVAELHGIDENSKVFIQPKGKKSEFSLVIERT